MSPLEILYQSDQLIAINKPHGLLVHPSRIARDADNSAMQLLRDQVGTKVYPVHRLDRKTSGVLLFALSPASNTALQKQFHDRQVKKTYHALVRGFVSEEGEINYPLTENDKTQDALTRFRLLQHFEIPLPHGKFPTSRYSWVELTPYTGRFHQLRKHMAHIFHPIIGDRPHGCNKQNKLWKETWGMTSMLLHAEQLDVEFPAGSPLKIHAEKQPIFQQVLKRLSSETLG
ncbi:MAG: pseudouridine synthase [Bacteroidota bacterium]